MGEDRPMSDFRDHTIMDAQMALIRSRPIEFERIIEIFGNKDDRTIISPPVLLDLSNDPGSAFLAFVSQATYGNRPKPFGDLFPASVKDATENNRSRHIIAYGEVGIMYTCIGDYHRAHDQFNKALDLFDEATVYPSERYERGLIRLARARTDCLWGNYEGALHDAYVQSIMLPQTMAREGPIQCGMTRFIFRGKRHYL